MLASKIRQCLLTPHTRAPRTRPAATAWRAERPISLEASGEPTWSQATHSYYSRAQTHQEKSKIIQKQVSRGNYISDSESSCLSNLCISPAEPRLEQVDTTVAATPGVKKSVGRRIERVARVFDRIPQDMKGSCRYLWWLQPKIPAQLAPANTIPQASLRRWGVANCNTFTVPTRQVKRASAPRFCPQKVYHHSWHTPLSQLDLNRAHIMTAIKAIVLSNNKYYDLKDYDRRMVDSTTLLTNMNIRSMRGEECFVVSEMVESANAQYLDQSQLIGEGQECHYIFIVSDICLYALESNFFQLYWHYCISSAHSAPNIHGRTYFFALGSRQHVVSELLQLTYPWRPEASNIQPHQRHCKSPKQLGARISCSAQSTAITKQQDREVGLGPCTLSILLAADTPHWSWTTDAKVWWYSPIRSVSFSLPGDHARFPVWCATRVQISFFRKTMLYISSAHTLLGGSVWRMPMAPRTSRMFSSPLAKTPKELLTYCANTLMGTAAPTMLMMKAARYHCPQLPEQKKANMNIGGHDSLSPAGRFGKIPIAIRSDQELTDPLLRSICLTSSRLCRIKRTFSCNFQVLNNKWLWGSKYCLLCNQ